MQVVVITASDIHGFFAVKENDLATLIDSFQTFSARFHLECTRLESQFYFRVFVQPVGHIIMVIDSVIRDRAEINPLRYFIGLYAWPVVIIFFMFDKDGTLIL